MSATEQLSASPGAAPRAWPVFASLRGWRPAYLAPDILAGLTLAAIAIPEQMATAGLAGVSPEAGFYAFLAGSLAFAIFGGSRLLSCGADSTISPIFAGGLALLAATGSPNYAGLAAALALIVGIALIAGGFFRMGWIADLLSVPVMTGFLAGISAHILLSQLPSVLGLPSPSGNMVQKAIALAGEAGHANSYSMAIGFGVLATIMVSEMISARIPGALIALAGATAAVAVFGLEAKGVETLGLLSGHLPAIALPSISFVEARALVPLGLVIALVVMVQTAATTRAFPSDSEQPPDVDRDYLGVGAGNILAALFGAFPVNASPPRTGILKETGARSQVAGLASAAILLAVLTLGAGLLKQIPHAALGGVLLFVGLRIVRVQQMAAVLRSSLGEFLLIAATFAAIVLLPIEQGVSIGIGLSLLAGVWSVTRAHAVVFERIPNTTIWWPPTKNQPGEPHPGIVVVAFQAPLSFLNAYHFRRDVLAAIDRPADPVHLAVLEASGILEIDFTAAQVLIDLIRQCQGRKIVFALARLESTRAQEAMARFGIDKALGAGRTFHSVDEAVHALGGEAPKTRSS